MNVLALRFCAMLLSLGALAGTAAVPASGAAASPIVAGCANAHLPSEILDGTVPAPSAPLAVVSATRGALALRLAVADDDATRELGLMCVTRLRPRHGMIFVFPNSAQWTFWMKNTLVPLDMVWLDGDGTITTIAADVPASTRATPDADVARRTGQGRFVVELAAGEAAADALKVGDRLTLPNLHASQ